MTIAIVAHTGKTLGASGGTSDAIDTTGATLLVVEISDYSAATGNSVTDSKSNTWTALTSQANSDKRVCLYYAENPTVGSGHTFSYGGGSNSYSSMRVIAASGTKTASVFDAQNGQNTGASQPGSITPSENNEIIFTAFAYGTTGTASIDSGYTITEQSGTVGGSAYGGGMAYLIQTSAGATNPTWSGDTFSCSVIASFKAAAAAAGQPTMKRFGGVPFASKVGGAHGTSGVNLWRKAKELLLPKPRRVIVPGFEFARGAV